MSDEQKITQSFKLSQSATLVLSCKKNDITIKTFSKKILSVMERLKKFYKIDLKKINIELLYTRKELNHIIGKDNTPSWLVACVLRDKIYIFSPSVIEKISSHKKPEVSKIINHELCHLYNQKLNKNIPTFFDEGIALYLSNQRKKAIKKADWIIIKEKFLKKDVSYNTFVKNDGYRLSYWFVKKIASQNSKKKLLELIKIDPRKTNYFQDFRKKIA